MDSFDDSNPSSLDVKSESDNRDKVSVEYNLRPRRSKRCLAQSTAISDILSDGSDKSNSPIENRDPKIEFRAPTTKRRKKSNRSTGKNKAPPLSKYRRKTANARERNRMREINLAFERLRNAVPQLPTRVPEEEEDMTTKHSRKGKAVDKSGTPELDENGKMTKITTLRLAVNYIAALSQVLAQSQQECRENYDKTMDQSSSVDSYATTDQTDSVGSFDLARDDHNDAKYEDTTKTIISTTVTELVSAEVDLSGPKVPDANLQTVETSSPSFGEYFATESRDKSSDSDDDLGDFEPEYGREALTVEDLALIPDEAFMRELFSLHSDVTATSDVFRLVDTNGHHDVVDFA